MNSAIYFTHGYLIQELSDEDYKEYTRLLSDKASSILVVCKPRLETTLEKLDVVNYLGEKLINYFEYNKIQFLYEKKERSMIFTIYNHPLIKAIVLVDQNYKDLILNRNYKKIIFAGYHDPQDGSFIDFLSMNRYV